MSWKNWFRGRSEEGSSSNQVEPNESDDPKALEEFSFEAEFFRIQKEEDHPEVVHSPEQLEVWHEKIAQIYGVERDMVVAKDFEDRTKDREQYIVKMLYAWIDRVLTTRGPEIDPRQVEDVGTDPDSQYNSKIHRAQCPHPFFSGESTSWNFRRTERMRVMWETIRQRLIYLLENADNRKPFDELVENIALMKDQALVRYSEYIGVPTSHLFVAGSGANAQLLAFKIFSDESGRLVSTYENGSEMYPIIEGNEIHVRYDDPKTGETNLERTQAEIAQEYINKIENGERCICFTICSKTGIRYDLDRPATHDKPAEVCALNILREYLEKNKKKYEKDPIYIFADAIQLAGRIPLAELITIITDEPFVGGVHSCSKIAGNSPHAAVLVLNDKGEKIAAKRKGRLTPSIAAEYQVVAAPDDFETVRDTLTDLRSIDNLRGIVQVDQLHKIKNTYDDGTVANFETIVEDLRATYKEIFEAEGFRILPTETPTIIAMEPPRSLGLTAKEIDTVFLTNLAKNGIGFGGYLNERKVPIMRFGLNIEMIKLALNGRLPINGEEFLEIKQAFIDALKKSIKESTRTSNPEQKAAA